jgi:hypothetical protein
MRMALLPHNMVVQCLAEIMNTGFLDILPRRLGRIYRFPQVYHLESRQ